ncbi:MAG: GntR family transcriptional regulator [Emergencia sp.]
MAAKTTLSEQIYDELYHDITDQRLVCGQKLTLKVLKERFGVSHTPIREALTRLAENGLVTYYSNCGVTVTEFTETDIRQIFQFIGELDALAVLFCRNAFSEAPLIFDLEQIIKKGDAMLEQGQISEWKEYSEEFHIAFYRHAQNDYLNEAARKLRAKVEVLSCMYYQKPNVEEINARHKEIYDAVKTDGDFDRAADLMRSHLQYDMVYALNAYKEYQENHQD